MAPNARFEGGDELAPAYRRALARADAEASSSSGSGVGGSGSSGSDSEDEGDSGLTARSERESSGRPRKKARGVSKQPWEGDEPRGEGQVVVGPARAVQMGPKRGAGRGRSEAAAVDSSMLRLVDEKSPEQRALRALILQVVNSDVVPIAPGANAVLGRSDALARVTAAALENETLLEAFDGSKEAVTSALGKFWSHVVSKRQVDKATGTSKTQLHATGGAQQYDHAVSSSLSRTTPLMKKVFCHAAGLPQMKDQRKSSARRGRADVEQPQSVDSMAAYAEYAAAHPGPTDQHGQICSIAVGSVAVAAAAAAMFDPSLLSYSSLPDSTTVTVTDQQLAVVLGKLEAALGNPSLKGKARSVRSHMQLWAEPGGLVERIGRYLHGLASTRQPDGSGAWDEAHGYAQFDLERGVQLKVLFTKGVDAMLSAVQQQAADQQPADSAHRPNSSQPSPLPGRQLAPIEQLLQGRGTTLEDMGLTKPELLNEVRFFIPSPPHHGLVMGPDMQQPLFGPHSIDATTSHSRYGTDELLDCALRACVTGFPPHAPEVQLLLPSRFAQEVVTGQQSADLAAATTAYMHAYQMLKQAMPSGLLIASRIYIPAMVDGHAVLAVLHDVAGMAAGADSRASSKPHMRVVESLYGRVDCPRPLADVEQLHAGICWFLNRYAQRLEPPAERPNRTRKGHAAHAAAQAAMAATPPQLYNERTFPAVIVLGISQGATCDCWAFTALNAGLTWSQPASLLPSDSYAHGTVVEGGALAPSYPPAAAHALRELMRHAQLYQALQRCRHKLTAHGVDTTEMERQAQAALSAVLQLPRSALDVLGPLLPTEEQARLPPSAAQPQARQPASAAQPPAAKGKEAAKPPLAPKGRAKAATTHAQPRPSAHAASSSSGTTRMVSVTSAELKILMDLRAASAEVESRRHAGPRSSKQAGR